MTWYVQHLFMGVSWFLIPSKGNIPNFYLPSPNLYAALQTHTLTQLRAISRSPCPQTNFWSALKRVFSIGFPTSKWQLCHFAQVKTLKSFLTPFSLTPCISKFWELCVHNQCRISLILASLLQPNWSKSWSPFSWTAPRALSLPRSCPATVYLPYSRQKGSYKTHQTMSPLCSKPFNSIPPYSE